VQSPITFNSAAQVCNAFEFWNRHTLAQSCEMKCGSRVWNHCHARNVTQHCIFMWRCLSRDGITRPVSAVQPVRPAETISSRQISVGTMYWWRHYEVRTLGYLPLISDNKRQELKQLLLFQPANPSFDYQTYSLHLRVLEFYVQWIILNACYMSVKLLMRLPAVK
jgi:hypothetical protein